jgi:hypothetical protein
MPMETYTRKVRLKAVAKATLTRSITAAHSLSVKVFLSSFKTMERANDSCRRHVVAGVDIKDDHVADDVFFGFS